MDYGRLCGACLWFSRQLAESPAEFGNGFAFFAQLYINNSVAAPMLFDFRSAVDFITHKSWRHVVNRVMHGHGNFAGGVAGAGKKRIGEGVQKSALGCEVSVAHVFGDDEVAFATSQGHVCDGDAKVGGG